MDFKKEITQKISRIVNIEVDKLIQFLEVPPDSEKMGEYAFPCFKLAKELKKAPQIIANEIKEKMILPDEALERVEVIGGYLNFYINRETLIKEVLNEFELKKEMFGSSKDGAGKNIVIDYSSPNIAKPFHIGHLRSTVIGGALYNIYQFLGYKSVGINHLGDYGTQFGKLIEGYKRWGSEYKLEEGPIDVLTQIYVRINNLCNQDENVLNLCRDNFKKLEDGDPYCIELWEKFKGLSLKEFQKVYDLFNCKFDSWKGESFYINKMPEIIEMLEKTGKLVESQGARVIELEEESMVPCIIEKTNGSSTYATRDLAAILYRARNYNYEKAIYVTSYEQILHFKQVFEVAKLLEMDDSYKENLIHVPFGMVLLKEGKMSTREGNIIKLEDLLEEAICRATKVIEEKNPNLKNKEEVARKVGVGAVIFNDLSNSRIKDEIFDWDTMLSFTGETGPYVQYIYVRTKSILDKAGYIPGFSEIDFSKLQDKFSIEVIKVLYSFGDIVKIAAEKNEPSVISRFVINLAQSFSSFYTENRIIGEEKKVKDARLYLTNQVGVVLKKGLELLGIEVPSEM
ncbi:MAG: arginine--tRNA ligase [Clostridia bacterium]|nr:arginine--tRNA ligase [Clostridia bacterium]